MKGSSSTDTTSRLAVLCEGMLPPPPLKNAFRKLFMHSFSVPSRCVFMAIIVVTHRIMCECERAHFEKVASVICAFVQSPSCHVFWIEKSAHVEWRELT